MDYNRYYPKPLSRRKQVTITIRPAKERDYPNIFEINLLAFGGESEAQLVEGLRHSKYFIPQLCLVAEKDGKVVGYILFSHVILETVDENLEVLALAPMAVHPEFQHQGIVSALVRYGLRVSKEMGEKAVAVLGHPDFYPRFGFMQAQAFGIRAPFPVPDEVYMVIELDPGALDGMSGTIKYPPLFNEV